MKKVLVILTLAVALLLCLTACHSHNFGEWSVTKNPTCTEDGVKTRYCSCGEKQRDIIPATGHNYVDNVCNNCGDVKALPECKHENLDVITATDPTCTETGLTEGKRCIVCKDIIVEQETIPVLDHDKRTYTEKDENCNVYNVTVCDRNGCDYMDRVATGVVNHAFGEWERVNNVTGSPCGIDKIYKRTCADCRATENKVEPTPDHNYKATVISTHNFNSATGEATIGEIKYTCQNAGCDSTYYEYDYHNYTQAVIEATCTEQGYTLNACSCGHSYKSDFTDKILHVPGAEATCTKDQICTVCGEMLTPALGHNVNGGICLLCGIVVPGLYDANDTLVASWQDLTDLYGMDISISYTINNYQSSSTSPYVVLTSNNELTSGKKLIIGLDATKIGTCAFRNCTSLESVTFAEGSQLETIDKYAFGNCTSLKSVVIPASVETIGNYAFYGCTSLESVTFAEGSQLETIGNYAFRDCTSLESIVIPASVTTIVAYAFYGCTSLESVTFAEGSQLETIGHGAFCGCTSLESVTFAEGSQLETINERAFEDCTSLESIVIPEGVTTIGLMAFYNCTSLTSVEIPASVTIIGHNTFGFCTSIEYNEYDNAYYLGSETNPYLVLIKAKSTSITSVAIHRDVRFIYTYAFQSCYGLKSVTIPSSVTRIGSSAFQFCYGLKSVTIPSSVTVIGVYAFSDCTSLESITYEGTVEQWNAITKGGSWNSNALATNVICSDGKVSLQ